jgi:hypothetical protein
MSNSLRNLKLILSFSEAKQIWAHGKLSGQPALTNFFLSQRAIERATIARNLWGLSIPGASIMLRRDRDFFHLYANFADTAKFRSLLTELPSDTVLVADVLQRKNSHGLMLRTLEQAGFVDYRELIRIHRSPRNMPDQVHGADIHYAKVTDAGYVLEALELNFDKFSEQLPELDEIVDAISRKLILLAVSDGRRAGFLFFESSGHSSILRYWFIDPNFRDKHLGSSLMRHYLMDACPNEPSQLWVGQDNANAIMRYNHYGYSALDLNDQIMIRK